MNKRYRDAIDAQSACNPGALCRRLAEIQREMHDAGLGTDAVRADPACRLIAYQIAFLFGNEFGISHAEYTRLHDECTKSAAVAGAP